MISRELCFWNSLEAISSIMMVLKTYIFRIYLKDANRELCPQLWESLNWTTPCIICVYVCPQFILYNNKFTLTAIYAPPPHPNVNGHLTVGQPRVWCSRRKWQLRKGYATWMSMWQSSALKVDPTYSNGSLEALLTNNYMMSV